MRELLLWFDLTFVLAHRGCAHRSPENEPHTILALVRHPQPLGPLIRRLVLADVPDRGDGSAFDRVTQRIPSGGAS